MTNAERVTNSSQIVVFSFKCERRSAPGNLKVFDSRQRVENLLGDAIGEIFLFLVRTHIHKRQDSDRFLNIIGNNVGICRCNNRLINAAIELPGKASDREELLADLITMMAADGILAESEKRLFALAAARRDRIGAVLFDDEVRTVIPPRLGWRHGLRVVREVLAAEPGGSGTALAEAVRAAGRLLRRRGVVIVLVDETCVVPRRQLVALAGRHEVVVVRVGDNLLADGLAGADLPVVDPEGGRRGVIGGSGAVRQEAVAPGIDVVELHTGEDYLPKVRAMLEKRERRRALH